MYYIILHTLGVILMMHGEQNDKAVTWYCRKDIPHPKGQ